MKLALNPIKGDSFFLDQNLLDQGLAESRANKRKRIILPLHRTQDALIQRMLNFLQPGTYIRPHMHPKECASETVLLMKGSVQFIIFERDGRIGESRKISVDTAQCLVDIEPKLWHTFIVREEDTIILEIKRGPYDADHDKVFAEWAPEEFTKEAVTYLSGLLDRIN